MFIRFKWFRSIPSILLLGSVLLSACGTAKTQQQVPAEAKFAAPPKDSAQQSPAASDAPSTYTTRIALAGDSTVTDKAGWGAGFAICAADKVQVLNFSRGGRSSKSFYNEGRWKDVIAAKPDYVLIQFGHNDQPGMNHGDKETVPETTYRANMTRYVDEAAAAGIKPVLVTPISRREFKDDGHVHSSLIPYAKVVRDIAADKKIPLIDLHDRALEVYESLGKRGCYMIAPMKADGVTTDGTHLNAAGGALFGSLMAKELGDTVPELNDAFPTSKLMAMQRNQAPRMAVDEKYVARLTEKAEKPFKSLGSKTITVAADGSGDFKSVQDAIFSAPANNADRTKIKIKAGVYIGHVVVPENRPNISFIGEGEDKTILSYGLTKHDPIPGDVYPGAAGNGVVVVGEGFHASNLTFRNTAGDHGQAMALQIVGDKGVVKNCRIVGWQDTLLINGGRQYFKDCYIEGRVDFIYGASTAVFEDCEIQTKYKGYYTAASTPQDHPFGFVFLHCKMTTSNGAMSYLGRPWRPYAAVAYIDCWMDRHVWPEGWHNWNRATNEATARYFEYKTRGPGANPSARAKWSKQLSDAEAEKYTVKNVLSGDDSWDAAAEAAKD